MQRSIKVKNPLQTFNSLVWLSVGALVVSRLVSWGSGIEEPKEERIKKTQRGYLFFRDEPNGVNSKTIVVPKKTLLNEPEKSQTLDIVDSKSKSALFKLRVDPKVGALHEVEVGADGVLEMPVVFEEKSIQEGSAGKNGLKQRQLVKVITDKRFEGMSYKEGVFRWDNLTPGTYVIAVRLTGLDERGNSIESEKRISHGECDRPQQEKVAEPSIHCALYIKSPVPVSHMPDRAWENAQKRYDEKMKQRSQILRAVDTMSQIPLRYPLGIILGIMLLNNTGVLRLVQKVSYGLGISEKIKVSTAKIK